MRARTASVSFRDSLVSRAFFSDDAFMYPSPYDVFVSMTQEADNPPSSGVATPALPFMSRSLCLVRLITVTGDGQRIRRGPPGVYPGGVTKAVVFGAMITAGVVVPRFYPRMRQLRLGYKSDF